MICDPNHTSIQVQTLRTIKIEGGVLKRLQKITQEEYLNVPLHRLFASENKSKTLINNKPLSESSM